MKQRLIITMKVHCEWTILERELCELVLTLSEAVRGFERRSTSSVRGSLETLLSALGISV
jgi:hypothetical protein